MCAQSTTPATGTLTTPEAEVETVVEQARVRRVELASYAAAAADAACSRDALRKLGELGLLGMLSPEGLGGGQAYEVYLQTLEELGWRVCQRPSAPREN